MPRRRTVLSGHSGLFLRFIANAGASSAAKPPAPAAHPPDPPETGLDALS
jgi:hypothetical protein